MKKLLKAAQAAHCWFVTKAWACISAIEYAVKRWLPRLATALLVAVLFYFAFFGLYSQPWVQSLLSLVNPTSPPSIDAVPSTHSTIPRGAIVFVHGLGGGSSDTWIDPGTKCEWPTLISTDDTLRGFDLYKYGFGSAVLTQRTALQEAIGELRSVFDDDLFRKYFHVVVVAHSLGGLVARQALVESTLATRANPVVTFISCGTPFDGSGLADALRAMASSLNNQHIDILETKNEFRQLSRESWKEFRARCGKRLFHFAAAEGKDTVSNVFVVKPESAVLDSDAHQTFESKTHSSLVKPSGVDDVVYKKVSEVICAQERSLITFPQVPSGCVPRRDFVYVIGEADKHEGKVVDVTSDIRIPAGATLMIAPGTTLNLRDGAVIECKGRILAGALKQPNSQSRTADGPLESDPYPEKKNRVLFSFDKSAHGESGIWMTGDGCRGSIFNGCDFVDGQGIRIRRPDPRLREEIDWNLVSRVGVKEPLTCGGAVTLTNVSEVEFHKCTFVGNSAWAGGAAYVLGSKAVRFNKCRFATNRSGYGGGALFAQRCDLYLNGCSFVRNETGNAYDLPTLDVIDRRASACGGAVYLGERATCDIRSCGFIRNTAQYVGGAMYLLDNTPIGIGPQYGSTVITCRFLGNIARGGQGNGAAIYVDQQSRINLTHILFAQPVFDASHVPLRSFVVDATRFPGVSNTDYSDTGVNWNGEIRVWRGDLRPSERDSVAPLGCSAGRELLPVNPRTITDPDVVSRSPQPSITRRGLWTEGLLSIKCYKPGPEVRAIDTIVIHHSSALKWQDDKTIQSPENADKVKSVMKKVGQFERHKDKYRSDLIKQIYEIYGVGAHYLIDREGGIQQLVRDNDVAFHAGKAQMPDGRTQVNDFSIGIELIASHPDDDERVQNGAEEPYTALQYEALRMLLCELCGKYNIPPDHIVGHEHIAPSRKKDPGPLFEWPAVREGIAADLKASAALWETSSNN